MGTRILDETAVDKIVYEERKSYFDITKTLSSFNFYCFFLHEGLLASKQSSLYCSTCVRARRAPRVTTS